MTVNQIKSRFNNLTNRISFRKEEESQNGTPTKATSGPIQYGKRSSVQKREKKRGATRSKGVQTPVFFAPANNGERKPWPHLRKMQSLQKILKDAPKKAVVQIFKRKNPPIPRDGGSVNISGGPITEKIGGEKKEETPEDKKRVGHLEDQPGKKRLRYTTR